MSDRSKDVAGYVLPEGSGPVLTSSLLTMVYELNQDFVELLLAERAGQDHGPDPCQSRFPPAETLPADVLQALEQLTPASRRAVSDSPFALYALRFDDATFWSSVLSHSRSQLSAPRLSGMQLAGTGAAGLPVTKKYCSPAGVSMRSTFCLVALFFVWHVLTSSRIAPRLLFALPDPLAEQLRRAPLWQLEQVALGYPGIVTPRWPRNPAFWPDLARFAAAGDNLRLRTTRLLGNQLIAAELGGALLQKTLSQGRSRLR